MKNTKTVKKAQHDKYNLGVFNGVKITLKIPSRWYTAADKDNKYFIESYYNQKQKQHKEDVRFLYNDYIQSLGNRKLSAAEKLEGLKDLYHNSIQEIITSLNVTTEFTKLTFNTNVIAAVNEYHNHQKKLFAIGEIMDLSNYNNRNKTLNDYFNLPSNKLLTLKGLNKEIWTNYRYYLLDNYNIKANSTINQFIRYVNAFYNWLNADKELPIFNHTQQLKKLDVSKQVDKYNELSNDVINSFFTALKSSNKEISDKWQRLNIVSSLVFENAVRPVQIYRLQEKDIHLSEIFEQSYIIIYDGKSKSSRKVFISDEVKTLIQNVYNKSTNIEPTDYLLGGGNKFRKGKAITLKDMRELQLKPFRAEYPQFENVLVYEFKHTTITKISRKDLPTAQRLSGHKKQSTTEIYNRSSTDSKAISRKDLIEKY